jgi:AhpD family alkylhydroperoxidase
MTKSYREITASVPASLAKLRADTPDVLKAFGALAEAATREGALTHKTKELIALALGVAGHCDACLGFHLKALIRLWGDASRGRRSARRSHLHGRRSIADGRRGCACSVRRAASARLRWRSGVGRP